MRTTVLYLALASLLAWGPAPANYPASDNPSGVSEDSCAVLENGMVPEMFGVDAALVSYRRSVPVKSAGHVLCHAGWDNPDKAEMDEAYTKKLQEWTRNQLSGKKEPMPKPPNSVAEVSVTLVSTRFDSAAAAVASLEDAVATLSKGVTVNVGGRDYTEKTSFGDWLDGVGDKAIFSESGELLVAAGDKRFSVLVKVSDDPARNRENAIALAKRIIASSV
jgi:hypothetical protein